MPPFRSGYNIYYANFEVSIKGVLRELILNTSLNSGNGTWAEGSPLQSVLTKHSGIGNRDANIQCFEKTPPLKNHPRRTTIDTY